MVVRSILADQWIGPEVFVMICGVLQKDASVHRGHFRFDWTGKAMPFVATAVPLLLNHKMSSQIDSTSTKILQQTEH